MNGAIWKFSGVAGILIGGDAIMGDFTLVLVELGRIEGVDRHSRQIPAERP